MALRHASVRKCITRFRYEIKLLILGICLKSVDGGAAPLAYGHAGRGSRLAIGAVVQIGRLLDPAVEIGSHTDDVV